MKIDTLKILALDTSSRVSSVALCESDVLVAESALNLRSTHSQSLLGQIDQVLKTAGWQPTDLDLLAVVSGPGAFTGVRIGVATIKGLAQVLSLPVVAISSLAAVALNLPLQRLPVCAFLDARKKEVYCQMFQVQAGMPLPLGQARVIAPKQFLAEITTAACFVGDAVPVYRNIIVEMLAEKAHFPPACCHPIQASRVAWMALQQYRNGLLLRAEEVLPTYIRASDAELNRMSRQSPQPLG